MSLEQFVTLLHYLFVLYKIEIISKRKCVLITPSFIHIHTPKLTGK